MSRLSPRAAQAEDLTALVELEQSSFDSPWSRQSLAAELRGPRRFVWVVESAERARHDLAGYACFHLLGEEAELLRLAVDPRSRRQGLGRLLVSDGLRRLFHRGARLCHLEVRASDRGAVAFYQEIGFHRTGQRPNYYSDGTDALLLSREIKGC